LSVSIYLNFSDGKCKSVVLIGKGLPLPIVFTSLFIASGVLESNVEWLEQAWVPAARNFLIRGTRFNQGVMLRELMRNKACIIGDPTQGHAVAIDARAPKYDGGIVTRVDCVSLGIGRNKAGRRFYDEGED